MKYNKLRLPLLILLIVAVGSAYLLSRSRRLDRPVGAPPEMDAPTTLADYRDWAPQDPGKLVFIGLDGASWDIIDPMIAEGILPTFARLKGEGSWGTLRSTDCHMSPPAWTTMMTGYLPERTGIYTFGNWLPGEKVFVGFSSLDIEVPTVWDIASAAGRRVAVTNVPMTYPALPVNGIMVSGLMTPIVLRQRDTHTVRFKPLAEPFDGTLDARSFSPRLKGTWVLTTTTLVIVLYDTIDDGVVTYDTVALKAFATGNGWSVSDTAPVVTFAVGEFAPFFQFDYRTREGDRRVTRRVACSLSLDYDNGTQSARVTITPLLRVPTDPDLRLTAPASLAAEIEETFGYYLITLTHTPAMIPQGVRWTADFADFFYDYGDWDLFFYVFQAPDNAHHADGIGDLARSAYQSIDRFLERLIARLPDDATLVLASDHGFKRFDWIISLNDYFAELGLLENPHDIDHDGTVVFHNQWCLYFNESLLTRDALERRGVSVRPEQSPRDALVDYLTAKCEQLKAGGRSFPIELIALPAGAVGAAPDMIVVGAYDDYFVEAADMDITQRAIVREPTDTERWFHDRDGMFALWGDAIKPAHNAGTRDIQDLAPTILYLSELPLARDFDGRMWDDVLRPGVDRPLVYIDDYLAQTPDRDFTVEELQSLEEKLRALGYIR